jgi:hypothetical protein
MNNQRVMGAAFMAGVRWRSDFKDQPSNGACEKAALLYAERNGVVAIAATKSADYAAGLERGKFLGKPVFKPFERATHVGKAWTYEGAQGGMTFKSKGDAEVHALLSGFRLPQPEDESEVPKVKVGDRIPAGSMGGIKMVLVVTKVIDEYRYEGMLEQAK